MCTDNKNAEIDEGEFEIYEPCMDAELDRTNDILGWRSTDLHGDEN